MTDTPTASVTVLKDGPIIIKNAGEFVLPGGPGEAEPMLALCRCGKSANKPFCDGAHQRAGWTDGA